MESEDRHPPNRLAAGAAAAANREIYWSDDLHCTAEGYRVIAEAVHRVLAERGLVP